MRELAVRVCQSIYTRPSQSEVGGGQKDPQLFPSFLRPFLSHNSREFHFMTLIGAKLDAG